MAIALHLDDIIYQLQRAGGVSTYWREITSRVANHPSFRIKRTPGHQLTRFLPTFSAADVFHSSYYRVNVAPKPKSVVTVHDFLYELGYIKSFGKAINRQQIKFAILNADAVICVSNNTKKDLLSLYPSVSDRAQISVIYNGSSFCTNSGFVSSQVSSALTNLVEPGKYVLFVGKRSGYKNFKNALLGFRESCLSKGEYSMFCVGSRFSDSENNDLEKLGLQQKVIAIGSVNNHELHHLYRNAFALVYPSLYEGFGLPPLEAMSCGCPVIASNSSSIPEVVGDAGILIDPKDAAAIAKALESLLDDRLRSGYIEKGLSQAKLFSWDKSAQKHIEIYQSLV